MATFTLTVQGETHEYGSALRNLLALGVSEEVEAPPQDVEQVVGNGGGKASSSSDATWTTAELKKLWTMMQFSEAQPILIEIAKNPQGYPFDDLQKALNMDGQKIGGRLSSVGHAMNKFPGKPHPLINKARKYYMLPEFAQFINNLDK